MKARLVAILFPLLTACATPYGPDSFNGGFSETQLSENVYRVTFQGNGFTDSDRASDFALLRSAELTLRSGYRYFAIGDSADRTQSLMFQTPTTTTASVTAYGNTTYGTATTTGGQIIPIIKPGVALTIFCACERTNPQFFDAAFLAQSLSAKYRVDDVRTQPIVSQCPTAAPAAITAVAQRPIANVAPVNPSDESYRRDIRELAQSPRYPYAGKLSESMLSLLESGRAKTTAHAYLLACENDVQCANYHGLTVAK